MHSTFSPTPSSSKAGEPLRRKRPRAFVARGFSFAARRTPFTPRAADEPAGAGARKAAPPRSGTSSCRTSGSRRLRPRDRLAHRPRRGRPAARRCRRDRRVRRRDRDGAVRPADRAGRRADGQGRGAVPRPLHTPAARIAATWLNDTPRHGSAAFSGRTALHGATAAPSHLPNLPALAVARVLSFAWPGLAVPPAGSGQPKSAGPAFGAVTPSGGRAVRVRWPVAERSKAARRARPDHPG